MFRVVHKMKFKSFKHLFLIGVGLFGILNSALADGPPQESSISNPVVLMLVIIMLILLLAIGLLSNVLLGSAEYIRDKEKAEKKSSTPSTAVIITGLLMLVSASTFAQEQVTVTEPPVQYIKGLSQTAFYSIVGVIALEITVILFMLAQLRSLLAKKRLKALENHEAEVVVAKQ